MRELSALDQCQLHFPCVLRLTTRSAGHRVSVHSYDVCRYAKAGPIEVHTDVPVSSAIFSTALSTALSCITDSPQGVNTGPLQNADTELRQDADTEAHSYVNTKAKSCNERATRCCPRDHWQHWVRSSAHKLPGHALRTDCIADPGTFNARLKLPRWTHNSLTFG